MAATDDHVNLQPFAVTGSCRSAVAVTPSDSTDLSNVSRALMIGTAGALKVTMADGTAVTFAGVPVGMHWIACSRVWSTGTVASNITALW